MRYAGFCPLSQYLGFSYGNATQGQCTDWPGFRSFLFQHHTETASPEDSVEPACLASSWFMQALLLFDCLFQAEDVGRAFIWQCGQVIRKGPGASN